MAEYPALPLWTDAFLGDTLHLNAEEVGCYLLLLMVAWRSPDNALPDRDEDLARFCRVPLRRWKTKIRPRLEPFFTVDPAQTWRQKRLDAERNFVEEKSRKAKSAAKTKWLKEKNTGYADASPKHMPDGMRKACQTDAPTPTPTPSKPKNQKAGGACAPANKDYAFKGRTIRLTRDDYDRWRNAYSFLQNFDAELTAADDYYTQNPPRDGKWYFPVSNWLKRRNEEAKARRDEEAAASQRPKLNPVLTL